MKISLRVTPTAKRNTYSVAWLVGWIPRVACFARNPGLGNRNTYSVAVGGSSRSKWGPFPAIFKGIEFQLRPHPSLPQGEGALPKCLKHSKMELPPLGEGWDGAAVGDVSGAIAPVYATGRLLAHDKLEGATCHDVGVGDVVLLILLAVEQSGCVVIREMRLVGRSGCVSVRGV